MLLLSLVFAAHAAEPCTLYAASGPRPPFLTSSSVQARGCYVEAHHAGPDTAAARDTLWTEYSAWLGDMGFVPARTAHAAPWNHVRWQRFEHDGDDVELQIRRPAGAEDWLVMLVPKGAATP